MEDPEIRAPEYIQQAYVEGGPNDVAVLAQLAQAEALFSGCGCSHPAGEPTRARYPFRQRPGGIRPGVPS